MKRILIIEDEISIAELERDYLEVNGFDSDIATTGNAGMKLLQTKKYNLILLDLMLPDVDGLALCQQLREKMDIPILMVTARKEDIDKIRGLDRGADDYIVKPFNPGELVARVKAHLSRYERLVESVPLTKEIHFGNVKIDLPSRRVFVQDIEKSLTAKEFDLLVYLATHPNRVFTKDDLFEKIWEFDSMGDVSTVTVHIRKIREKIEVHPSFPSFIETIWGVGYRFNL